MQFPSHVRASRRRRYAFCLQGELQVTASERGAVNAVPQIVQILSRLGRLALAMPL
jgi:hypothetical protein